MFDKVLSFYKSNISGRFLYKVIVLYTVILSVVFIVSFQYISVETRNILKEKQIFANKQILVGLQEVIKQKVNSFKDVVGYFYQDSKIYQPVMDLLDSEDNSWFVSSSFDDRMRLIGIFQTMGLFDKDITDITIFKKLTGEIYQYQKDNSVIIKGESGSETKDFFLSIFGKGLVILPTHKSEYLVHGKTYNTFGIKGDIYLPGSNEMKGAFIVNYDISALNRILKQFDVQLKGSLRICNKNGGIVFDSLGRYYVKENPPAYASESEAAVSRLDAGNYVETYVADPGNLIYSSTIPASSFNRNVNIFQNTAYIIAFITVLLVFLMYTVAIGVFSRRVKMVVNGMSVIGNSNLSYRIPMDGKKDEIGQIANQFNKMCDNLQEYIKKAYIYELKQKNSELNRLQAQVNPHFLYNTLEAIRFRAEKEGCEEIGEMIYALASLFRFSIKGDMVVDIAQELEYCRMYMKIFSVRYEDYFYTQFDIDERIQNYGIIKNLLPPLIENYVVHGFDSKKKDNRICINGSMAGQDICFEISDNGKGIDAVKLHEIKDGLVNLCMSDTGSIGLVNVIGRIKIVFGNEYGLDLDSIQGQGTRIIVRIPAKTKEEIRNAVETEQTYK